MTAGQTPGVAVAQFGPAAAAPTRVALFNPVAQARGAAAAVPGAQYLEVHSPKGYCAARGAGGVELIDPAMRDFL